MSGASRISGRARMLATIRSKGALAGESRVLEPGAVTVVTQALDVVEPRVVRALPCTATGSMSVASTGACASFAHGDGQHPAAGAEVERVARVLARATYSAIRGSRRGAVMAGAKGQRRLDLDGEFAGCGACRGHARHGRRKRPARPASALPASAPPNRSSGTISSPIERLGEISSTIRRSRRPMVAAFCVA